MFCLPCIWSRSVIPKNLLRFQKLQKNRVSSHLLPSIFASVVKPIPVKYHHNLCFQFPILEKSFSISGYPKRIRSSAACGFSIFALHLNTQILHPGATERLPCRDGRGTCGDWHPRWGKPGSKGYLYIYNTNIWMFPNIGVPPNHPINNRVVHYKPSTLGYHYFWKHLFPMPKWPQKKPGNFLNLVIYLQLPKNLWRKAIN